MEGNPADPEFIARTSGDTRIELILLPTEEFRSNLASIRALRQGDQHRKIAATATWPDEIEALQEAGADLVFSIYADAGNDFAHRVQGEFFSTDGMSGSGTTR